ncbi:phage portal protein [Leptolyngbya sp. 7M]|uniref:phage portal protein n=1 Tax=Leptolyngbya sp. 7M TaxID=2812896 RepID=UPI001B8BAE6F|nr:phage portal protein [Leptolyngbya sp. 7M]QYO65523.1 phage portal protein [Leptolyngbya sp. 7M]
MNIHIEEFIHNFRAAAGKYAKPDRYYRGAHDLAYATEKFENAFGSLFREFALNLCPAVCDAVRDKLRITGFSYTTNGGSSRSADEPYHAQTFIESIWHRNRMPQRAGEVHREALVNGDSYVIVWPDEHRNAAIHPNRATQLSVAYDEDRPGQILRAAKFWRTADKYTRMNLFYPDRIERYVTAKAGENSFPDAREFIPFRSELLSLPEDRKSSPMEDLAFEITNPFGVVPVFHFANNSDVGAFGRSELESAIPVQDGLNKSVLDMLVAMEYSAYRQRWAAGIEIEYDNEGNPVAPFKAGIDHLWLTANPDARFGDFGTADLDQFLKVKDSFRIDMASVTGTPMYYLLPHTRGFPSGEAMQRAESRFVAKVRDRQMVFGQTWAEVMQFAMEIEGHGKVSLKTHWEDPSSTTERERIETELLKQKLGQVLNS